MLQSLCGCCDQPTGASRGYRGRNTGSSGTHGTRPKRSCLVCWGYADILGSYCMCQRHPPPAQLGVWLTDTVLLDNILLTTTKYLGNSWNTNYDTKDVHRHYPEPVAEIYSHSDTAAASGGPLLPFRHKSGRRFPLKWWIQTIYFINLVPLYFFNHLNQPPCWWNCCNVVHESSDWTVMSGWIPPPPRPKCHTFFNC